MEYDAHSAASSPLSSVATLSPSPPPDLFYPSPPASHASTMASPIPETRHVPASDDGLPPKKRRKTSEPKPRTTQYLDLSKSELTPDEDAQLQRLLKVLHDKRKIVVIAGAGISVSAGIPDFRSSNGLFKTLRGKHGLKSSGKELFDASVYQDEGSTATFHAMVRELSEQTKLAQPTPFHHLLATLAQEGRLLRLYSQNVDGIDTRIEPLATTVPLVKPWPKTIQVHGGLDHMVCSKCHKVSLFQSNLFKNPLPPLCTDCEETDNVRTSHAGKRSHGIGKLRPRMVLYNEHNPDAEAIGSVTHADLRARPDAVIVAGTTLKVPGVRRIAREMCNVVRDRRDGVTIWLNNDPEPSGKDLENLWDLVVKGPCDEVARHAAMRKWTDDAADFNRFEECTPDHVKNIDKAKGLESVSIISPAKPKPCVDSLALLTPPIGSPQFGPQNPRQPTKQAQTKVVQKTFNAASKGKTLPTILGNCTAKKTTAVRRKPGPKKKVATAKTTKITTAFTASKVKSSTTKSQQSKAKRLEPITPQKAMEQIPPQDARVNSSPTGVCTARKLSASRKLVVETIYPTGPGPRAMEKLLHMPGDSPPTLETPDSLC